MLNENQRSFILGNSLAAVSAVFSDETTLATDGNTARIHIFKRNGVPDGLAETVRPYIRLRCSDSNRRLTALSCGCERRIYFIGEEYRELGYTEPELENGCEITDASVSVIDNEPKLIVSTRKNAYLFDLNGKNRELICQADRCEEITDFIRPSGELFALATESGGVKTVSVFDGNARFSAILQRGISLRMLISKGNEIFGLFGFGYIYNRIIRIYAEKELVLPHL